MFYKPFLAAFAAIGAFILVAGCTDSAPGTEAHANHMSSTPQDHGHDHGQTQDAEVTTAKSGKYEVSLRIPEGGLYAGEEIDVEFRVVDITQKDPVEEGFKGVANVKAEGLVTMPSMAGMPAAKPEIHREGIPGDYGIVLDFPHGGAYQIDLTLTPPNEELFKVTFKVNVADEKSTGGEAAYSLNVVDWPAEAKAGQPVTLKLQVVDNKTGKPQTTFDVAHEKEFHLLIASKDLGWFAHEHPEMAADGTWSLPVTFPAGTDYWVYGDVAPTGKGSRILISQVKVSGPAPTWKTDLTPTLGPSENGGLKATLEPTETPIPISKMTALAVKLTDAATGKPTSDIQPWLGAAGHLMIIHQDGQTVVHSHPDETEEAEARLKNGEVRFNARFPKTGLYKAYAQFQRGGQVRTLPFTLEIK